MTRVKSRKAKKLNKIFIGMLFAILSIFGGVYGIGNYLQVRAAGAPSVLKKVTKNGDGTYQISLDVKGDSEKNYNKANVIVVLDSSGSMDESTGTGRYYESSSNGYTMYGLVNGEYIQLTRHYSYSNGYYYTYTDSNNQTQTYTGTRYLYDSNASRMEAAKDAVTDLARGLLSNNTASGNGADLIEIALIDFDTNATIVQQPTTDLSTFISSLSNISDGGGTNWEAALQKAADVDFEDPANEKNTTYVIFVSDGNPTFHSTDDDYNDWNSRYSVYGTGHEDEPNVTNCYNSAKDDARSLVNPKKYEFYTIGVYGNVDRMEDLTKYALNTTESVENKNYFSAANTAKLQEALNTILQKIELAGFGEITVADGTTKNVTVSSGTEEGGLIDVDTTSFKYYLSFPISENPTTHEITSGAERISKIEKNSDGTYKLTNDKNQVFDNIIRVPELDDNGNEIATVFKMAWTSGENNPFYTTTAPAATLDSNNAVVWDLDTLGVLFDEVTYRVTFDVWPSQVALDLIADLKNGKIQYGASTDDLGNPIDSKVWTYLDRDYNIKTNTDQAYVEYTDTRVENDTTHKVNFQPQDPIGSASTKLLTVTKEWENTLDSRDSTDISLKVNRDSETRYAVELPLKDENGERVLDENDNPIWSNSIYASVGIMSIKNGEVSINTAGHDYSFAEEQEIAYYWELDAPTVHPMWINGEVDSDGNAVTTMLVKLDTKPNGMGDGTVYTNDGKTYYKIGDNYYVVNNQLASLTATNNRRSYLQITKNVDGKDAPADSLFKYNIKVTDGNNDQVWFSIYDPVAKDYVMNKPGSETEQAVNYVSGSGITPEVKLLIEKPEYANNFRNIRHENDSDVITYEYCDNADTTTDCSTNGTGWKSYTVRYVSGNSNDTYRYYTGYYKAPSTTDLTILLQKGWSLRFINLPTSSHYEVTETEMPAHFSFVSVTGDGTVDATNNKKITGNVDSTNAKYEITYTNKYELTSVKVTKDWQDNNDQDGKRVPVQVSLYKNNGADKIDTITLDGVKDTVTDENKDRLETEAWVAVFNNLDRFDADGNEIDYTVDEDSVPEGYTKTTPIAGDITTGYTITNTHTPEKYDDGFDVTKTWIDFGNKNNIRPNTITITLTGNVTKDGATTKVYEKTVTIGATSEGVTSSKDANNNDVWTYTFKKDDGTNLDKYALGIEIEYTLTETDIAGYTKSITGTAITNTLDSINIPITKEWIDDDDRDGLRPDSVKLTLQRKISSDANFTDVITVDVTATNSTVSTDDNNTFWTYTFENYNKYDQNGNEYTYQVVELEANVPSDYEMSTACDDDGNDIIINSRDIATSDLEVTKVWEDFNNANGIRPDSVSVTLTGKDGSETVYTNTKPISKPEGNTTNTWTYKFLDVPTYANGGHTVSYTITETPVKGYKEPKIEGLKVTNTLDSIDIPATKKWVDDNDRDGIRPDSVKLTLQRKIASAANFTDVITVEVTAANSTVTTEGNDTLWAYTFENYNKYDQNGNEYTYQVVELEANIPTDYEMTRDGSVITNTHSITTSDLEVTKVWEDFNNANGIRPDSVSVTLTGKDGTETVYTDTKPISKPEGNTTNTWTYKFLDVPTYANGGHTISYTITETPVKGYKEPKIEGLKVTNTLDSINIPVTKKWVDDDNRDGIRPDSVKLTLQRKIASDANFTDVITVDVTATNSTVTTEGNDTLWSYTFENYNKYDAEGNEYTYQVVELEANIPTDYEMTRDGSVITNTHDIATSDLEVTKVWEDFNNANGIRPDAVSVTLTGKDGTETVYTDTKPISKPEGNTTNTWTYKFLDVPTYANGGHTVSYTITETPVKGYKEPKIEGLKVTNTLDSINIPITKKWVDDNDRDGIRPDNVKLTLQRKIASDANFTDVITVDVTATNSTVSTEGNDTLWAYTFENYNKYDQDGNEYTYQVVELEANIPTDYEMSTACDDEGNDIIINSHDITTDDLEVTKVWEDFDNANGIRPDSVSVTLTGKDGNETVYTDTKPISKPEGNTTNTWTYKFLDVPTYANGGHTVSYTITETPVKGYKEPKVEGLKVTNTLDSIDIPVTKKWVDDNDRDGIRPDSVKLTLQRKLKGSDGTFADVITVDVTAANSTVSTEGDDTLWAYTFKNYNKYNAEGKEYEYQVVELEANIPDDYDMTQSGSVITNMHGIETDSITITKIWDDFDNANGIRPETVSITLKGTIDNGATEAYSKTLAIGPETEGVTVGTDDNGNVTWTYKFEDVPMYAEGGKVISYSVSEAQVKGYKEPNVDGFKITNTLDSIDIPVTKKWVDDDNRDGIRPNEVKLTLQRRIKDSGSEFVDVKTETITTRNATVTTDADKNTLWDYTFENYNKYDAEGNEYEYQVVELETNVPDDYDMTRDGSVITNTHTIDTDDVTVTKVWDDDSDRDGKRPDTVTLLLLADDNEVGRIELDAKDGDSQSYTFPNMPVNSTNGKPISYTADELSVPTDYEKDDNDKDLSVTNSYSYATRNITVKKVWDDDNDRDGNRPKAGATVNLMDGNTVVGTVTLKPGESGVMPSKDANGRDTLSYTFINLPVNKNHGTPISYSINENPVGNGYDKPLYTSENNGNTLVVTNPYSPDTISVKVTKVWVDDSNRDGSRPETITLLVKDGDTVVDRHTINARNGDEMSWTFDGLPKYKNGGTPITYTAGEVAVEGYTMDENIAGDMDTGYTITNRYSIETVDIPFTKVWSDNDDQDGYRPDKEDDAGITVKLMDGDEVVATKTIKQTGDTWSDTFVGVPKYKNGGTPITYTLSEDSVAKYTTTIDQDKREITNKHIPETTEVNGSKVWVDESDAEGFRPTEDGVTVRLYADGEEVDSKVVKGEGDEWAYSFTKLPKYKDHGVEIKYTVDEDDVDNYDKFIDKEKAPYVIVNTHTLNELSIKVTKDWVDAPEEGIANLYGHPDEIDVVLVGRVGTTEYVREPWTLTKEDNWTHTFTELPEYRQGDYVTYTVEEITDVQDYDRAYATNTDENELIVRNIYKPTDYVTISGEKIWEDDDNRDNLRPNEITLTITDQYDNEVATVTVKESENWKYSIQLPKYGNGVELQYKITEENVATGYTSEVTDYNVTNTHEIATVSFNITKIWSDNNNHDNIRPESITVRIMDGETEVAKKIIQPCEENNYTWTYTFENLPKYKNGALIDYKIIEDEIAGYTYTVIPPEEDDSEDYIIENTHEDSTIDIVIEKIWDDYDDISQIRPEKINVTFLVDGTEVEEYVITAKDGWRITIPGLMEFHEGGIPIVYSVVETPVPEYDTTYETDGHTLKIKNHHELGIGHGPEEEPPQTGLTTKKNNHSLAFILSNMLGLTFFVRKIKES